MNLGVTAHELRSDACLTKVGTHAEVGDGCHHGDSGCDVVEDAMLAWLHEREANEGERRHGHDSADCLHEWVSMTGTAA